LHDDVIGNKATYTIPLNPVTPAVAKEILAEYRVKELFVTVKDIADDAAITVLCKPGSVSGVVGLVQQGAVTLWQLSPLIFQQKK
jgi:hypothetical protein